MKKIILLLSTFLFIFCSLANSQTRIDRFCEVSLNFKNGLSRKMTATILLGELDSLFSFKDSSIIDNLKKVNTLTTAADVLNYMSNLGWTFITVIPISFGYSSGTERFYFRRSFNQQDMQ